MRTLLAAAPAFAGALLRRSLRPWLRQQLLCPSNQLRRGDPERPSQIEHCIDLRTPESPLQQTYRGAVQPRFKRQLLLRNSPPLPNLSQGAPEGPLRSAGRLAVARGTSTVSTAIPLFRAPQSFSRSGGPLGVSHRQDHEYASEDKKATDSCLHFQDLTVPPARIPAPASACRKAPDDTYHHSHVLYVPDGVVTTARVNDADSCPRAKFLPRFRKILLNIPRNRPIIETKLPVWTT